MKMKTYKTWELLKMAESYSSNDKTTAKRPNYINKSGKTVMIGEAIGLENGKGLFTVTGFMYKENFINEEWTLVQQPVTFLEAIKAFDEGKTVRHDGEFPHTYKYDDGDVRDENGNCISSDEVLNCKWFIEED